MKKPPKTEPKATWLSITRYTHHLVVGVTTVAKIQRKNCAPHWRIEVLGTQQMTAYQSHELEQTKALVEKIATERIAEVQQALSKTADARGVPRSTLSHAPEQPWDMKLPIPADPTQSELVTEAYGNATAHGFSEGWSTNRIPEKLMLIVTEAAEAMEDFRLLKAGSDLRWIVYEHTVPAPPGGGFAVPPDQKTMTITNLEPMHNGVPGKPCGFLSELADIVIRVGDLVGNIGATDEFVQAVVQKMAYNRTRPFKHGNKSC